MNFSMDWPLSREEKKSQLLRLYSHDVMAADNMLASGNQTLEALRAELEAVRSAAGIQKSAKKLPSIPKLDALSHPASPPKSADDEVQRLRQAVESAAAVLRALLPEDEADEGMGDEEAKTPPRLRARSEGAFREPSAVAARPALCRTPRESRRPKRKVSFGGEPEQEPAHSPAVMKEEEEEEHGSTVILQTPPAKVRQVDTPVKAQTSVEARVKTTRTASTGSRLKVPIAWLMFGLVLVVFCGLWAYKSGSSKAAKKNGDKACWKWGFTYDFCCDKATGEFGNVECWDTEFTFDRCCQEKSEL